MPEYILKLSGEGKDFYLLWSTVSDSPASHGMPLDEFRAFYKKRYERSGLTILDEKAFEERLRRVEQTGCSAEGETLDDRLSGNRAGDNEAELSKAEILRKYCFEAPND